MIKILFMIHDLSVGGAEKVLVNLVNNMDKKKFDITVLALFDGGVNRQFLNKSVKYQYVFKKTFPGNSHLMKFVSPKKLYSQIVLREYDIVVSYLEGPTARIVGGCSDGKTKVVSWIHFKLHTKNEIARSFRSYQEAFECYNRADIMVFVSEEARQSFLNVCPVKCRTAVLYNTNESQKIIQQAMEPIDNIKFENEVFYWCGVGKIVPNKGFDRMVHIQKRLLSEGYQTKLLILGIGNQREELEKWCKENGISDTVQFLGYQTNPYKYVAKSDLFVCASHEEGFSTAATEALIVGTPVCTVDVSGMKEMLGIESEYGMIVENSEEALYRGIKSLLDNPVLLKHYQSQAVLRGKNFSTHETVCAVQNMFLKLIEGQI